MEEEQEMANEFDSLCIRIIFQIGFDKQHGVFSKRKQGFKMNLADTTQDKDKKIDLRKT